MELKSAQKKVSVVVVAFGSESLRQVGRFLASLELQTYPDLELVLVDNSRSRELREFVDKARARSRLDITYIASDNTGYAGGNVIGVRYARGELVLILNPDAWLENDAIEMFRREFDRCPSNIMILVPKILIRDSDVINSVGMRRMRGSGNLYTNVGYLEHDRGQYDEPRRVEAFDGTAFIFRIGLLAHTFLFDPRFFFGHETTDLAERVDKLGFEIWTCPSAVVRHEVRGTVPASKNDMLNILLVRNALVHTLRNKGWSMFWRTLLVAICYGNIVKPLRRKDYRRAITYARGVLQFILDLGIFA